MKLSKLAHKLDSDLATFTIAIGSEHYLRMAYALARSYMYWNGKTGIPFVLVTSKEAHELPSDLVDVTVITVPHGIFGSGFSPKLYLDQLAPAQRSLFVDADCICVGNITRVFDALNGNAVSVIGNSITEGEWFGDVAARRIQFGVPAIPRFNGGLYYIERGSVSSKVYQIARDLEKRYDECGFVRLRGHPNDEVLVSVAMALCGQEPVAESGTIMNSLLAGPAGVHVDVFKGYSLLKNPKGHPGHNSWYELETMSPVLVHFVGCPVSEHPYLDEVLRLELVYKWNLPRWLATFGVRVWVTWPAKARIYLKQVLRPLFRIVFGVRAIRSKKRF